MSTLTDAIGNIKQMPSYRGQIYSVLSVGGREASHYQDGFSLDEETHSRIQDILDSLKLKHLFQYQGEVIQSVLQEKSVGVFGVKGSGKRTAIAASAAAFALVKGKTALIICDNDSEAEMLEETIEVPLGRIVRVLKHSDEHVSLDIACDILISTDQRIKELIFGAYEQMRNWTSMLGLIAISDITAFSAPRISHIQGLLGFFNSATKSFGLTFLISGEPIGNPSKVLGEMIGVEEMAAISIYADIGKDRNPFEIISWQPPYRIEDRGETHIIKRNEYYEELGSFFALFRENENLLIWHACASVGRDKLGEWIGAYQFKGKITFVNNLHELQLAKTGLFDGLILLGIPKNPKAVIETLGNILKPGSIAGLILPDDPFSHFLIKTEAAFGDFAYPDFIVPKAGSFVTAAYLFIYAHLSGARKILKSDLTSAQQAVITNHRAALKKAGFLLLDEDECYVVAGEDIVLRTAQWFLDSQTAETTEIRFGSSKQNLDTFLFPHTLFPGAIRYFGDVPCQLIKENEGYVFARLSGIAPVKRVPLISYSIVESNELDGFKGDFEIGLFKARIEVSWKGFREHKTYTADPKKADVIIAKNRESYVRETYLLSITNNGNAHEISHLLRIWLPLFYSNFFDFYDIFYDNDNIYLCALLPNQNEARDLLLRLPTVLRKVFEFSKELLLHSCPCKNGCPFCLEILDCPAEIEETNKKSAILRILEPLKEDMGTLIRFKYEGLNFEEAQKYYEEVAKKVFAVFEKKLDLLIRNKVPMTAVKESAMAKKGCIGLFTANAIQVIEKLDEANATEVIAHEYAHNWAAENMRAQHEYPPGISTDDKMKQFLDKLMGEGFAQWVTFKVMDFFGLESSMEGIYLWPFDEYGEGFRVLNWLENQLGFMAVINFAKYGKIEGDDGAEWGLDIILERSGFKARVLHWVANKSDQEPDDK